MMIYVWLGIIAVLLVIEFLTMGLTTVWFAGGAVAGLIAAALHASMTLQIFFFAAVSVFLLFMMRPFAARYLNRNLTKTNADALIGHEGIVREKIDNLAGTGLVDVNGQNWTARTAENDTQIETGTVVVIREIRGVKLIVERKEQI